MAVLTKAQASLSLGNLGTVVLRQGDSDPRSLWGGRSHINVSGTPVAELQAALISAGTLTGKPDGQFGLQTTKAVHRFQWYLENVDQRLRVFPGGRAQSGSVQSFSGGAPGSRGMCSANLALELLAWKREGYVTTTPLVRLGTNNLSHVDLSPEFKLLDYPAAADGEVLVHADFAAVISSMFNEQAKKHKVTVLITQTFRRQEVAPSGAVVTPAKKSQHLVGHAVDINLKDGNTVNTFDKFDAGTETAAADAFVAGVKSVDGIRWGGDFADVDYVHFDDYLDPSGEEYEMTHFFVQGSFHANHPMRLIS